MLYGLFIWSVITVYAYPSSGHVYDWKLLAELKPFSYKENTEAAMLEKCRKAAEELNLPKERYRCVRIQ